MGRAAPWGDRETQSPRTTRGHETKMARLLDQVITSGRAVMELADRLGSAEHRMPSVRMDATWVRLECREFAACSPLLAGFVPAARIRGRWAVVGWRNAFPIGHACIFSFRKMRLQVPDESSPPTGGQEGP